MSSNKLEEIREVRLKKREILEKAGFLCYPSKVPKTHDLKDVNSNFENLESAKAEADLAGRVTAIRGQGAILFVVLNDGTDEFQVVCKKDVLGDKAHQMFFDTVDVADFISVHGEFFKTEKGQPSLLVKSWTMATKALLPLPDKWHGMTDEEERLRKRYLDLFLNKEERELFVKKAKFWEVTRNFLKEKGFLEIETPTLEVTTGGAEARPFKTHHNDFDVDLYLRISVGELWQKRLMAAGFPMTFEIGRVYRNEGSSPEHIQEFTNMEFYAAYMSLEQGKKMVQELYRKIAKTVFDTTVFTTRGHTFDLDSDWIDVDYADEIKKRTGIDIFSASLEEMGAKLKELGVLYEGKSNKERLTDTLWKYCRKQISGPAFLVNHPLLVAPLSKVHPEDPRKTEMFQVIIGGSEMGRAHSELNDPIDQKNRFDVQHGLIADGDDEAMMPDFEFVEMLEHGMPPTFGFGFGERLFAFMIDRPIRETQLFPLVKPKGE